MDSHLLGERVISRDPDWASGRVGIVTSRDPRVRFSNDAFFIVPQNLELLDDWYPPSIDDAVSTLYKAQLEMPEAVLCAPPGTGGREVVAAWLIKQMRSAVWLYHDHWTKKRILSTRCPGGMLPDGSEGNYTVRTAHIASYADYSGVVTIVVDGYNQATQALFDWLRANPVPDRFILWLCPFEEPPGGRFPKKVIYTMPRRQYSTKVNYARLRAPYVQAWSMHGDDVAEPIKYTSEHRGWLGSAIVSQHPRTLAFLPPWLHGIMTTPKWKLPPNGDCRTNSNQPLLAADLYVDGPPGSINTVVLARPTAREDVYLQMLDTALYLAGPNLTIVDVSDGTEPYHTLSMEWAMKHLGAVPSKEDRKLLSIDRMKAYERVVEQAAHEASVSKSTTAFKRALELKSLFVGFLTYCSPFWDKPKTVALSVHQHRSIKRLNMLIDDASLDIDTVYTISCPHREFRRAAWMYIRNALNAKKGGLESYARTGISTWKLTSAYSVTSAVALLKERMDIRAFVTSSYRTTRTRSSIDNVALASIRNNGLTILRSGVARITYGDITEVGKLLEKRIVEAAVQQAYGIHLTVRERR